ncbi:ectoine/hydroxyectoine ABC transporter, permease protein EhuC [compost metagenome]
MANDLALNPGSRGSLRGRSFGLLRDPWVILLSALAALGAAWAATGTAPAAVQALWHWSPALLRGMGVNIQISVLAMALGTAAGLAVGALSLSPSRLLRRLTRAYVLLFRNAPILVLVYFTTYVFPFELSAGRWTVPFPDWIKVVIGLGLPASANVAEIFRGAIQSIPSAQWEAAQSLSLRRAQIFRMIVLP